MLKGWNERAEVEEEWTGVDAGRREYIQGKARQVKSSYKIL